MGGILVLFILAGLMIYAIKSESNLKTQSNYSQKKTYAKFGDGTSMYDFKNYVNSKADKHLKEMEIKRKNQFK